MPATTTRDLPAATVTGPTPGRYQLRPDRCVVEPSLRVLGVPALRGRFTATAGRFDIDPDGPHTCTLRLRTASLRTGVPLLSKVLTRTNGLNAAEHPAIEFVCREVGFGPGDRVALSGRVTVRGKRLPLYLSGTVHYADPERVVLWVRGVLHTRRPVHIEAAVEFVR